jgi:hypothetical protein
VARSWSESCEVGIGFPGQAVPEMQRGTGRGPGPFAETEEMTRSGWWAIPFLLVLAATASRGSGGRETLSSEGIVLVVSGEGVKLSPTEGE